MTLLAGFVVIAAIAMPFWIKPKAVESNDTEQESYYGLWAKCTEDSTESTTCDKYQNIFIKDNLPPEIVTAQAFAMFSAVVWTLMLIPAFLGMNCVNWKKRSPNKGRFGVFGGIGFIITGMAICVAAAVWTWIGTNFKQFHDGLAPHLSNSGTSTFATSSEIPMEISISTILCYICSVAEIMGGVFLILGSRRSYNDDRYIKKQLKSSEQGHEES